MQILCNRVQLTTSWRPRVKMQNIMSIPAVQMYLSANVQMLCKCCAIQLAESEYSCKCITVNKCCANIKQSKCGTVEMKSSLRAVGGREWKWEHYVNTQYLCKICTATVSRCKCIAVQMYCNRVQLTSSREWKAREENIGNSSQLPDFLFSSSTWSSWSSTWSSTWSSSTLPFKF